MLREIYEKFDFPRADGCQKEKARKLIIEQLNKFGYDAAVVNDPTKFLGFMKMNNFNVVTKCEKPDYIISAHYDTIKNLKFAPFEIFIKRLTAYNKRMAFLLIALFTAVVYKIVQSASESFIFKSPTIFMYALTILFFFIMLIPLFKINLKTVVMNDDNTSGVASVLYLANRFKIKGVENIQFAFFDNEEKGRLGSKGFAERVKNEASYANAKLINLDCVGRGVNIYIEYEKAFTDMLNNFTLLSDMLEANAGTKISLKYNSDSDCKFFSKNGFEGLSLIRYDETVFNGRKQYDIPWTHTYDDVREKVDFEKMNEVIGIVEEFFAKKIIGGANN